MNQNQQQQQPQGQQAPPMTRHLDAKPAFATCAVTSVSIEQAVNKFFKEAGLLGSGYIGCRVANAGTIDLFFSDKLPYVKGKSGSVNSPLAKRLDLVSVLEVDMDGLYDNILGEKFVATYNDMQNGYEEVINEQQSGFIMHAPLDIALRTVLGIAPTHPDVVEIENAVPWDPSKGNALIILFKRYNVEEMNRIAGMFGPTNYGNKKGGYNPFRAANANV